MNARRVWVLMVGAAAGLLWLSAAVEVELTGSLYALFWFTVIITIACAIGALALLRVAWRSSLPELGILAAGLYTVSILPMVHGFTLPGVLYGPNPTTMFSVLLGLPAGIVVMAPLLVGHRGIRDRVLDGWKVYASTAIAATSVAAVVMLAAPGLPPEPGPRVPWALAIAAFGVIGALLVGRRHVDLYAVGRRRASLVAGVGWSFIGVSSFVWLVDEQLGLAVWAAHALDGFGVLLAVGGLIAAYRRDRGLAEIFAPVLNRDPVVALRLGVTPVVDEFLMSLGGKDAQTRGHVVRVAELAMNLGIRAGFRGERLRTLGLAALMHDVGKVRVRGSIITKTGPLTAEEYEEMKLHTVHGEDLLATDTLLLPASRLVRSHHERVDGDGYPDGLKGSEISIDVGIIGVADAWDAMVQTRHYRAAMSEQDARQIVLDNAGSQWPAEAVQLLLAELDDGWELRGVFAGLGQGGSNAVVCGDTVAGLI